MKEDKNLEQNLDNSNKKLHISDVISRLSKLNRYDCDTDFDEDGETCNLTTQLSKTGRFVRWSDIECLLNDL